MKPKMNKTINTIDSQIKYQNAVIEDLNNTLNSMQNNRCVQTEETFIPDDLRTLTGKYIQDYGTPDSYSKLLAFASCVASWQKRKTKEHLENELQYWTNAQINSTDDGMTNRCGARIVLLKEIIKYIDEKC
jgi:hypothetical protein